MTRKLIALHGFFGQPDDWSVFKEDFNLLTPSLSQFTHGSDLWQWSDAVNDYVSKMELKEKPVIIGYSMGGRLALHALLRRSELWSAAVIVSAHPGLFTSSEKQKRLESDHYWASRFQKDNWGSLIDDWNRQDVFRVDRHHFERKECDFDRNDLAKQLITGSLGNQDNLRELIINVPIPILWIVGERDQKFVDLASSLTFANPHSKILGIPNAGHRAIWSNLMDSSAKIKFFLGTF